MRSIIDFRDLPEFLKDSNFIENFAIFHTVSHSYDNFYGEKPKWRKRL